MQIGNLFGSYDKNMSNSARLDSARPVSADASAKASTDLPALKEGSVFKGEITDISGEKVMIALDNQTEIPARLQGDVSLGIGDELLFLVKENNDSQIFIKPMFESLHSAQTQVLEKALDMAGLSSTEKNFQAAKMLMDAGMALDKGSITQVLSQSMKFPDTAMNTLVALNKMNIPVTEENIAQFERYESYQHQFASDISEAVSDMAEFGSYFPEGTSGETILSFAKEMVSQFVEEMPQEAVEQGDLTGVADEQNTAETVKEGMLPEASQNSQMSVDAKGGSVTGSAQIPEQLQGEAKVLTAQNTELASAIQAVREEGTSAGLTSQKVSADTAVFTENVAEDAKTTDARPPVEAYTAPVEQNEAFVREFSDKSGLDTAKSAEMIKDMKQMGIPDNEIAKMVRESKSPEELLSNTLNRMSESEADDAALKKFVTSDNFKKMFTDMVHKSWSLDPKQMKSPKEIDDMYERILKQSQKFENAISDKGGDAKGFQGSFQNMRQNMSFMEQLNNQMIYAQMPLKLTNQNANSELFIYADKRKLMEKRDGISVMLHLDMDHLGQTDVKVTLTGSNVHARFYLGDQSSVDIVADNMSDLAKQLGLRGFSLTNEVVKRNPEESDNKVVDEIIDENAERSIKRFTFDARM